jgi:hypothetical protein
MTPELLLSISNQLTRLREFYTHQNTSTSVLEFPETFEVTSDDGYSLGKFAFDADGEWVFVAYETML